MSRKEFTQGIVNELKQKIYEFKNKKQSEKAERKNELDFEINQDLVNKFKRNHKSSSLWNKKQMMSTYLLILELRRIANKE